MTPLLLVLSAALSGAAVHLWWRARFASLAREQERLHESALAAARTSEARLGATLAAREQRIAELNLAVQQQAQAREAAEQALQGARAHRATLETQLAHEKARIDEKLQALREQEAAFDAKFRALSGEALQHVSTQFLQLAQERFATLQEGARGDLEKRQQALAELVAPVRESLERVDRKIVHVQTEGAALGQQLKSLLDVQQSLRNETQNLVRALRAPQVRGRWGEMHLRRAVELAGMTERCDFVEQQVVADGKLRPDLVVRLPGARSVVIDAKVPLASWLDAMEAQDDQTRRDHLAHHARQVRKHVEDLSRKAYWEQFENAPDFVVLFLPNDATWLAAQEQDTGLVEDGFSSKVLVATPTTLIALLKTVALSWRQQDLARDAQSIAEAGRELYKRLATLSSHFGKVGRRLESAVTSYNEAVGSLERSVLPGARKLKEKASATDAELEVLPGIEAVPRLPQARELVDENVVEEAN